MEQIEIERNPSDERLRELGVSEWPIWTKEVSDFIWPYERRETCYFLEGEVVVTPEGGESVELRRGDLVTFPQGVPCRWQIRKDVKKHYRLG